MVLPISYRYDWMETLASIKAMQYQEEKSYRCSHYLNLKKRDQNESVDTECRHKMAEWSYNVTEWCNLEKENVAYCMNYLDRFLMTPEGQKVLEDRNEFQLAAITCLYMATKIHGKEAIDLPTLVKLSRDGRSKEEFEKMERRIITSLKWRLNPPTALAFINHFVMLLPKNTISPHDLEDIIKLAIIQIEQAISSYTFVGSKASIIASAALKNSLLCWNNTALSSHLLMDVISSTTNIDFNSDEILCVQRKLFFAVATSSSIRSNDKLKLEKLSKRQGNKSSNIHYSPRSVFASEIESRII